jgi:putative transcriptional regulator
MTRKQHRELLEGLEKMVRIVNGESTPEKEGVRVTRAEPLPDARPAAIRSRLDMTQREFAALLNIPLRTVQGWEAGRRRPDPAAVTLLRVAATAPQVLRSLLKAS